MHTIYMQVPWLNTTRNFELCHLGVHHNQVGQETKEQELSPDLSLGTSLGPLQRTSHQILDLELGYILGKYQKLKIAESWVDIHSLCFIAKFYKDLDLQLGTYSHGSTATFYSATITQMDLQRYFQDLQQHFSNATITLIFCRELRSSLISYPKYEKKKKKKVHKHIASSIYIHHASLHIVMHLII